MAGCVSREASNGAVKTCVLPSSDNGTPSLRLEIPSGFSMHKYEGPDFDVFYFTEAVTKSTMGLYSGSHPSLSKSEAGDVRRQPGRVGDVSVEWLRWSQDGKHHSETLVPDFYGQKVTPEQADLVLHIFIETSTEQDIARMESAVATLSLESAR